MGWSWTPIKGEFFSWKGRCSFCSENTTLSFTHFFCQQDRFQEFSDRGIIFFSERWRLYAWHFFTSCRRRRMLQVQFEVLLCMVHAFAFLVFEQEPPKNCRGYTTWMIRVLWALCNIFLWWLWVFPKSLQLYIHPCSWPMSTRQHLLFCDILGYSSETGWYGDTWIFNILLSTQIRSCCGKSWSSCLAHLKTCTLPGLPPTRKVWKKAPFPTVDGRNPAPPGMYKTL